MLYSILIYGIEGRFERLPEEEQERLMQMHRDLQAELEEAGRLGPVLKLMGTGTAVTVRQSGEKPIVMDGPFAETKEQLLGVYLVECETIDEAIAAAKKLPQGVAAMEVRPVSWLGGSRIGDSPG